MRYALVGDIHSSTNDLEAVLLQVAEVAPDAKLIGTGDLYECTISKKNITDDKFEHIQDVMLLPDGFRKLLTFPSIRGNQEERIVYITKTDDPLREELENLPETMQIGDAFVIHGHQWHYGDNPWEKLPPNYRLVFFGHTHRSEIFRNGQPECIRFDEIYKIGKERVIVNVGSVTENREWVLYDEENDVIRFMKA
ncbi:putative phosphodiesterase [Sporosarcina luteola]|nr:putative phosphodiesterase [Sporosarcina luteola]